MEKSAFEHPKPSLHHQPLVCVCLQGRQICEDLVSLVFEGLADHRVEAGVAVPQLPESLICSEYLECEASVNASFIVVLIGSCDFHFFLLLGVLPGAQVLKAGEEPAF